MATARGTVDLSGVPAEDWNEDLEIRVAASHGNEILGSTLAKVDRQKRAASFRLDFDPIIDQISRIPCGIRFLVGPNVSDRDLMGLDVAVKSFTFDSTVEQLAKAPGKRQRRSGNPSEASDDEEAARSEAAELRRQEVQFDIDVGAIEVPPHIYRCWLFCCRTYRIRGRVVCRNWSWDSDARRWVWCDDPVPGAEVDIYDVDRFLWWYSEDLITTVTTQFDGTFEATFRWCCARCFPWCWPYWRIDDDILRRIRELLAERNVILPPIPPDPDPTVIQSLVASLTAEEQASLAAIAQRSPSLVQTTAALSTSAETLRAVLPQSDELASLHVWPWFDWNDCAPDVIFRVRQNCDGKEVVVHDESPSQARWDIPTTLNVTLLANDKACCVRWCRDPECPDCMKLTYVGCSIPIDQIGDASMAGPPDLRGYWLGTSGDLDRPLWDSLLLRARIGPDIDYVRPQYSKNGGPWTDLVTPQFAGYSRRYWGPGWSPYIPFSPETKNLGMSTVTAIKTRHHYEELNPGLPTFFGQVLWDDDDSLLVFDSTTTPSLGDGLYHLRFLGYAADNNDDLIPASERVIRTCGLFTPETVYLRIDNQASSHPAVDHACGIPTTHLCFDEPEAYIRSLIKNEGMVSQEPVDVCDIVSLEETDTLTIHFTVNVPPNALDGHLGGYEMSAIYGASLTFPVGTVAPGAPCPSNPASPRGTFEADPVMAGVQVGPSYAQALTQGATRPYWYGGNYKVTLRGCDFPECCAYEIYLHAWKRTSNGCQVPEWTHWNRYDNTFTVLRRNLCPDVCKDNDHGHHEGHQ